MSSTEGTNIEGPADAEEPRKLRRSGTNRWIAGVCGGLAEYFGLDAAVYRILFAALAFAGGTGILLYVAAALVIPAPDREESVLGEALSTHRDRPWLVIGLALLALWFVFLASPGPFGPGPGVFFWPGALLFWLVVLGGLVLAARGLGGRRRILAALAIVGVLLALVAAAAHAAAHRHGGFGDVVERPLDASELRETYRLGVGELELDLREVELPPGETHVEADVGFGQLDVIVPDDVAVSAVGEAEWGDVSIFGRNEDGRDVRGTVVDPAFEDAERRLVIDARVRGGELTIRR